MRITDISVAVACPAEVAIYSGTATYRHAPTTLIMVFDCQSELDLIRAILRGEV